MNRRSTAVYGNAPTLIVVEFDSLLKPHFNPPLEFDSLKDICCRIVEGPADSACVSQLLEGRSSLGVILLSICFGKHQINLGGADDYIITICFLCPLSFSKSLSCRPLQRCILRYLDCIGYILIRIRNKCVLHNVIGKCLLADII